MSHLVLTCSLSLFPKARLIRHRYSVLLTFLKMPQVARSLNVLVVGGGLGGLATALTLQTDGHSVRVIDAVPEFAEVSIQNLSTDS